MRDESSGVRQDRDNTGQRMLHMESPGRSKRGRPQRMR